MRPTDGRILGILIIFRIFNALEIRTFFQPDEYWQSLEPAHHLVYGYGYLTWEWRERLRSAAHPLLYAVIYKLANWMDLDVVIAPKIFQGVCAALGDFFTYKFGRILLGSNGGNWTLAASMFSAFNWYVAPRTFSNSLETVITSVALCNWPWSSQQTPVKTGRLVFALSVASIACIFRPSNALLWAFLGLKLVLNTPRDSVKILSCAFVIAVISLSINFLIDFWYFDEPVFPPGKFVSFNIFQSLSHFYGTSPWHYYISQGLPILLIGYLPFTISELYLSRFSPLVHLIFWVITSYSFLGHKEVRFIYPLIPVLHVLFAKSMMRLTSLRKTIFVICALINTATALFFSTFHQSGVISLVDRIRSDSSITSIGLLMPCHSTPWQSHIHRDDIDAWFLTCEPPLGMTEDEQLSYLDEADEFYDNPTKFIQEHLGVDRAWPSHLAIFSNLWPDVKEILESRNYREAARFFNGYFHEDWRRKGDIVLLIREKN